MLQMQHAPQLLIFIENPTQRQTPAATAPRLKQLSRRTAKARQNDPPRPVPSIHQESTRLPRPKPCIEALVGEKLRMGALLDNASFIHHDQPVHRRNGR